MMRNLVSQGGWHASRHAMRGGRRRLRLRYLAPVVSLAALWLPVAAVSDGTGDSASGSGIRTVEGESLLVEVNAQSGPAGEDATGHFAVKSPPGHDPQFVGSISGRVTCLTVVGNRAVVGGEVERSEGGLLTELHPVGSGILIEIVDNDKSGGEDGSDIEPTGAPPPVCPPPVVPESELEKGNYKVHDEPIS